jgi:hypothetical protein
VSFVSERSVKAVRKRHVCDGCGKHIQIGDSAQRWAGLTEGDFGTAIYHPDCRAAEVELNNDILGWNSGDDWLGLRDIEQEDWPWLRDKHPAVAWRMGLARPAEISADDETGHGTVSHTEAPAESHPHHHQGEG